MIPIRVLLVEDALPVLRRLKGDLEAEGSFEVFHATSMAAGMLSLVRVQPDVLVLNPYAGRGSVEEWRRTVERYRNGRSVGLVALAGATPARDREVLAQLADLGILRRPTSTRRILSSILNWMGQETTLARAS
jgi:hypothetical protein